MASKEKKVYFVKLFQEDGKKFYQAIAKWNYSEGNNALTHIELELVDIVTQNAYTGAFSAKDFEKLKEICLSDDTDALIESAFCSSSNEFSFQLLDHDGVTTLVWKKGGARVKIRLASIQLKKTDFVATLENIFNEASDLIREKSDQLKAERGRKNELMETLKDMRKKADQMIVDKEDLEKTLIGRFLPILHAKQDKIRHLMKEVEDLEKKAGGLRGGSDNDGDMSDEAMVHTISSDDDAEEEDNMESGGANRSIDSQNFLQL